MRHSLQVTPGNAVRWTEDGGVAMNGKELDVQSRRPFSSVLGLAFMLCLTAFGDRALFAFTLSPAPHVRFDQTVIPPASICSLATTKPPDVPPQVLIGEPFTFRVRFNNGLVNGLPPPATGAITGYGPFIDLVLDAGGESMSQLLSCACDGMTFVTANVIHLNGAGAPLVTYQSLAPCVSSTSLFQLPPHPFAGVQPVWVPAGSQLVTIELPFGSFDPTQPEVVVEVTASVSPYAVPYPLRILARGGFRYGGTLSPTPGSPVLSDMIGTSQQTDSTQWLHASTTPTALIVHKKYLGPEDENATGPNLPYYPRQYEITVDIANAGPVTGLTLSDTIPPNMVLDPPASLPPGWASAPPIVSPGLSGTWTVTGPTSITGGPPHPNATINVPFHVPLNDASGLPVLPATCDYVHSVNTVQASYDWMPVDPCHGAQLHLTSTAYHDLVDKCMAIQKSVAVAVDTGTVGPTPDDILEYTLKFQVSDFRNVGDIKIHDVISDGQTLLTPTSNPPFTPTLTVTDQCGTIPPGSSIPPTYLQIVDSCPGTGPFSQLPSRTTLDIDVSQAMIAFPRSGILRGGYTTTPSSAIPGTGEVRFRTRIDDKYQCTIASTSLSPHDQFVDKDDPLSNDVTITATIYENEPSCAVIPSHPSVTVTDVSKTCLSIVTDVLKKTVYAIWRPTSLNPNICGPNTTPCPSNPEVMPGDRVTFRLEKTIPSSDAENLTIQDWLPLPIFDVAHPAADGTPGPGWPFISSTATNSNDPPPSGIAWPTASDTLSAWLAQHFSPPTLFPTVPVSTNSLTFNYGTFNDPTNQPGKIDLLFTLTVTNTPFADGLYLTNEAQECESNTFGVTFCQAAIAQVHVREPALKITKGVVAASNPNAVFTPPPPQVGPVPNGPVPFSLPGSTICPQPRFTGTITSANLAAHPINNNVSSVDANDCVTFAIVVENTGGSPAYDIKLHDLFPLDSLQNPECFDPNFATLCVTDGMGHAIPFTSGTGFLNGNDPITLQSPLPGLSATGSNIAVITFDACVIKAIKPHCCDNIANIESYASTPGGPNFVAAGFGGPFQDSAQVCVLPKGTKSIKTTSEAHTPGTPTGLALSPEQLAIGEIIRYRLEVLVPETTSPSNYTLTDLLPPGLQFLNDNTTRLAFVSNQSGISSGFGTSPNVSGNQLSLSAVTPTYMLPSSAISPFHAPGIPFACGLQPSFNLGNLTNTDNDSDQEFIVLEFNALVCNIASNQNGTALNNSFGVLVGGQQVATSNSVSAVVVEPKITITKVAAVPSLTVGATATYTVTLANNGTATAFDVRLTDQLPDCLTNLTNIHVSTGVTATNSSTPTRLDLMIASIPVNGTVTVTYSATVSCVDCSELINTAKVTWTSLPGPVGSIVNPTTSSTPGASGLANGERDDSNGYVASATASLCCMLVSNETINCNPIDGTFTYTFTVTNFSTSPVSGVNFSPPPPGVTITPSSVLLSPALLPGHSATVTVTISGPGAVSGVSICFSVSLGQAVIVCTTKQCITLPKCCVSPPSGMVAWWPLDETAGTMVADIAGNLANNNGTSMPGAIGSGGPISQSAKVNNGFNFCGPRSVTVADKPVLNFGTAQSFSIDAWIRRYSASKLLMIVDKLNSPPSPSAGGYRFYVDNTNKLKLDIEGAAFTSTSTTVLTPGNWYHVAVTVDRPNQLVKFYINGTPEVVGGDTTFLNASSSNLSLLIAGTHETPLQAFFDCEYMLDEIEIFNRALTQAEIQGIVNPGSAGKCKQSDLAITKKAANTPWTVGGMGSFTLLVENLAPGAAVPAGTVITVTENLPAGLTLAVPPPGGVGWTCTPSSGAGPLVVGCQYTVPSVGLAAGGSLPLITFTVNVTAATAAGAFLNCASVQGQLVGGAILQEPTSNDTSCITIPTGSISPVLLQIPVVLDAFGVSPAHYTSDLVAVNRSGGPTPVTMKYFPSVYPTGWGTPVSLPLSSALGSGREVRVPDVLAFLRANSYAPISVPPEVGILQLTFANVSDPSLVFAGSRATTPNPSTKVGGRFGLFLTGTLVGQGPSLPATIFALREDGAYRSNLAIEDVPGSGILPPLPPVLTLQVVNGDTGTLSGPSFTYSLGPGEWHQFNSILGSAVTNGYVTIKQIAGSDSFLAYGVINDGPASGGGTSDGSPVRTDGADGLVPIVMSVTSSGFLYTSELVLTNPAAFPAVATLTYTPSLPAFGVPYTASVSIGAGQQIRVPDAIAWLRDILFMPLPPSTVNQGGTLLVSGATAYVRTSNPNPDMGVGGTFGLAYPAVPASGRAWTEAWVYGLVQDSATRTNVAIADARVGDSTLVTYLLEIFNADIGSPIPVYTVSFLLAGGQWTQVNGLLSLPMPAITHGYVRVSPSSVPSSDYVVYGVLNDGAVPGLGTSDGSYVPMSGVH
jgi:uncharacterized repeat protein (TIGR01451 family)